MFQSLTYFAVTVLTLLGVLWIYQRHPHWQRWMRAAGSAGIVAVMLTAVYWAGRAGYARMVMLPETVAKVGVELPAHYRPLEMLGSGVLIAPFLWVAVIYARKAVKEVRQRPPGLN